MDHDAIASLPVTPRATARSRRNKGKDDITKLEPASSHTALPPASGTGHPNSPWDVLRANNAEDTNQLLENSSEIPLAPRSPVLLGDDASPLRSSRSSPEPNETDLEGHYVGPSSGVSFLLRVQKRLHENLQFSAAEPIFNFGDAPLPTFDPHFLMLPPIHEAKILVEQYFDFSFPTFRFLHRATVDRWLQEFYSGIQGTSETVSKATKAVVLMVMAQGKQYLPDDDRAAGNSVNR